MLLVPLSPRLVSVMSRSDPVGAAAVEDWLALEQRAASRFLPWGVGLGVSLEAHPREKEGALCQWSL